MKRRIWHSFFLCFAIVCLLAMPVSAQTDTQKITVRVQGATIHASADAASEVIEKPSVGTAYEVVMKTGEWYEIKIPSSIGMTITGFIHEKYLNMEKPVVEPRTNVVQTPVRAVPKQSPRAKRVNLSLAGLYHRQSGYDYSYTNPNTLGGISDSGDDGNAFGVQLGAGFFVVENIEVDLGFHYAGSTSEGAYALDMPFYSGYYSDYYNVHEKEAASHGIREMMFNLGLSLHLLRETLLSPYLGGGFSYINGKVELLEDFTISEEYAAPNYEIVIKEPKYSSETVSTLGFFGKAGVDIAVSPSFAIFGEGQYLYAKKEIPHPFGTAVTGKEDPVEIDLGGISALFGVKARF
jgi:opacity protein-like surface antigen